MRGRIRLGIFLPLVLSASSCGDVEPPPESSPWLITWDETNGPAFEDGVFRAHRIRDGKVEHVLLETAKSFGSWSPSGEWLAYRTQLPNGSRGVSIQRFDGDRWYEPQPLELFGPEAASVSSYEWSPTSDLLLYSTYSINSSSGSIEGAVAVAMPRADGAIATTVLEPSDSLQALWAPSGDRILLGSKRIVDVPTGTQLDGPWPSRELAPPAGMVFDPLRIPSDAVALADGTFSTDGRWINFVLKREDTGSRVLYAFSTTGDEPPRGFESCPLAPEDAGGGCWPHSWLWSGATLFAHRPEGDAYTLEAWSPATGARSNLGNVAIRSELGRGSSRVLTRDRSSDRTAVVDLRDVASPEFIDVPTTDQPSFFGTGESPDGRWLLLMHQDELQGWFDVVDLRAPPPWQAREIYRIDGAIKHRSLGWSPGGSFIIIRQPAEPDEPARISRIDVETGNQGTFEDIPPRELPDGTMYPWVWETKIAYDDRTAVIDRDGTLAIWRMDRPRESATILEGVPASVIVTWVPDRRRK